MITISKRTLYFIVVAIIAFAIIGNHNGIFDRFPAPNPAPIPGPAPAPGPHPAPTPTPAPNPSGLNLTPTEARDVQSAINVMLDDIDSIRSIETARVAFSSMLPPSARDRVMAALGNPSLFELRDALLSLEGKVIEFL